MKRIASFTHPKILVTLILSIFSADPIRADDYIVSRAEGARLKRVVDLSNATATRIEISQKYLREAFDKTADGAQNNLPIPGTSDNVVISRSGNNLHIVAIVDNIGCNIKVNQSFKNFTELKGTGRILIDRNSSKVVSVTIIAGNVGSVINVNVNADNRKIHQEVHPDDDERGNHATDAVSGLRYRCHAGQTLRFPRGYQWWDGSNWIWGAYEDQTVTFDESTYVYAR